MYRISKRTDISTLKATTFRIIAVLAALLAAGLFFLALGYSPLEIYGSMVMGAFGKATRLRETIIRAIPLLITSLGIGVAFKMKFWNIGAEGQILMGAFAASFVALKLPEMPRPLTLTLMMLAGIIGGGLFALIPAFFKSRYGTNETLFTLMMNYIALKFITYLQYGPWKDPKAGGFPKIPNFTDNAILPNVFGVHIGWIIALLLTVLIYVFINHTKRGYEICVVGESENTARYAGMNVSKIIMFSLFLSGGLCGLTGMIEASAVSNSLSVQVSGGVGYTAIITTWLAQLSAPVTVVVSILFAALIQGGSFIQTVYQIPNSAAQMLQGLILFFVLGSEFFIQYQISYSSSKEKEVA